MKSAPQWANIPEELRNCNQWLLAAPDEKGDLKVPTSCSTETGALKPGSSTDRNTWLAFDFACAAATHYGYGIGFVVDAADPFCCIDLDVKNENNEPDPEEWTGPETLERHNKIYETFVSYAEWSQSGQGLHIWVYASIGRGVKRDFTEVYSQERFLVCTGNVLRPGPIVEYQEYIDFLVGGMRKDQASEFTLVELPEEHTDEEIVAMLSAAVNGEKFNALCRCTSDSRQGSKDGTYRDMGFPTQSEADLALMSMFCFRSQSNEQCMRLFRMTGLGKRQKATKDNKYLKRTLRIIRGRQAREVSTEQHGEQVALGLLAQMDQMAQVTNTQADHIAAPANLPAQYAQAEPAAVPVVSTVTPDGDLEWPPGFVGAIARFIYESSVRPVREVSIVSALGLFAGICGKAWNIPQSGLNLYVILIARSAVGKEAMHGGISNIIHQCMGHSTNALKIASYVDFNEYASGPALSKAIAVTPSILNVSGEWGKRLKRLAAEEGRDGPMSSLRTVMTHLYQKSGHGSIVGGMGYSDKEKNVASVNGVAYSMIGETTPGSFYEALTETMMEDGFLSRFTVIEYTGNRPPKNANVRQQLSYNELEALTNVITAATMIIGSSTVCHVVQDQDSQAMLEAFDKECDDEINKTTEEAWRQMWNRAHLKVCRISALLAVADSPYEPVIRKQHVAWALTVVRRDIAVMSRKLVSGDVGVNDMSRERKLLSVIASYFQERSIESYRVPESLRKAGMVPRKYLQMRTSRVQSFMNHKQGSTAALDSALRSLVDSGYICEVQKDTVVTAHGFHGKTFRVLDIPSDIMRANI